MAFNPLSVEVVAEIPGMPEYKSQREYFKPMLITDYEKIFIKYKKLEEDDKEYEKIKKLYKKWSEAKKKIILITTVIFEYQLISVVVVFIN